MKNEFITFENPLLTLLSNFPRGNYMRKFILQKHTLLMLFLLFASIVNAANRYVATTGSNSNSGTSGSPWLTIQYAVNNSNPGDVIHIASGNYTEQVEISKNLSIVGAGSGSTNVISPASLPLYFTTSGPNRPVIYVHNSSNVIIKSLTVDGAGQGNLNYRMNGIGYDDAGGTIQDCEIKNIRNTPIDGLQDGIGIFANAENGTGRTLLVVHNNIHDFQKNATVFAGNDLTVTVDANTITGAGNINFIAQNGIQLSDGTKGSITNNTVNGFSYTPNTFVSCGILVYSAGGATLCANNTVNNSQVGIYYISSSGSITGNKINYNAMGTTPTWYGIDVDDGTTMINNNEVNGGGKGTGIEADAYNGETTNTSMQNNKVNNLDTGLVVWAQSINANITSTMNYNSITGSIFIGIYNYGPTTQDATCNWYGSLTGPKHISNPGGTGDAVSDYLIFKPWLTDGSDNSTATGFQNSSGACNGFAYTICDPKNGKDKKDNKVMMCHNGKTECVNEKDVPKKGNNWSMGPCPPSGGESIGATGINSEYSNGAELNIYPNPTASKATLIVNSKAEGTIKVNILSITGEVLFSMERNDYTGFAEIPLDLSKYAAGMYFVQVSYGDKLQTLKVQRLN